MSSLRRMRRALCPSEWRRLGALAGFVLGLHAIGFGTLLIFVAPRHFSLGHAGAFGLGLGITAYTLGLRHAFDADHIAAIDNTTRKLMGEGQRPLGVGFFFSLGHSTIVFALALALALGLRALGSQVSHSGSALHQLTGLVGTSVSGAFLYLIAAINAVILVGIAKACARVRAGERLDQAELERLLGSRGLINRIVAPVSARVRASWHMYPLGMLFGLGFDTATEVALLFLAAGAASSGLPVYAIMCLPVLFAAGMSLLDTIDGSFMNFAYGWAFSRPARKLYYNLVITGLSVAVALLVGSIELLSIATSQLGLRGGLWAWISSVDLNTVGFVIVGLFVLIWALALAVWRWGRIEERWSAAARSM
jgi:nickel/cobalt transporter (NiCoT) family protein